MEHLQSSFLELVRLASTDLPADVETALEKARDAEQDGNIREVLGVILRNVALARERSTPICQDTGHLNFFVRHPASMSKAELRAGLEKAVVEATERAYLRPNAVDALTGANSGNNLGTGFPAFYFEEHGEERLEIDLLLKGGGSENVSAQYKLPHAGLGAGRDLEGVRRVVLDAVVQAQGKGCSPGILGVGIGGDRAGSYLMAKRQLLRPLDDAHPSGELSRWEKRLCEEANTLGIGPMGFGGKTTLLAVKAAAGHRLPACYFVSVAYVCWAARRKRLVFADDEVHIG